MPATVKTSANRENLGSIVDCNQKECSITVMLPESLHTDGCCTQTISQAALQSALGVGNAAFKNVHEIEATAIQNGTKGHLGISLFHDNGSVLHTNTRATHMSKDGKLSQHHFVAPPGASSNDHHPSIKIDQSSQIGLEAQQNAVRQMARWSHFLPEAGQEITAAAMMKGVKSVKSTLANGESVTQHAVPVQSPGAVKSELGPVVQMVQANVKNPMCIKKVFGDSTKGAVPTISHNGTDHVTFSEEQMRDIQADLKNNLSQKSQFDSGGLTIGAASLDGAPEASADQAPTFVRLTFKRKPVQLTESAEVSDSATALHVNDALTMMNEPVQSSVALEMDGAGADIPAGLVVEGAVKHEIIDVAE